MQVETSAEPRLRPTSLMVGVRKIVRVISTVCLDANQRLVGHRWHGVLLISAAGMLLGLGHYFDLIPAWPHAILVATFVLFLTIIAWARIAMIHAEAGHEGWGRAMSGAVAGLFALLRSDNDDEADNQLSAAQRDGIRSRLWASRAASISVVLYMMASLLGLVPKLAGAAGYTQAFAIFVIAVSAVLWMRGNDGAEQGERARKFATLSTEATEAEFLHLPPVLELKKTSIGELTLVHRSSDELLRELLIQLPNWKPRQCKYETQYEAALYRFLRRRLPGVHIETQVPVTPDPSRGGASRVVYLDLVLDRRIAIELKRNLNKNSELDRCIGQVRGYADLWRERGPLFVLVCESKPDFVSSGQAERLIAAQRDGTPFRVLVGRCRRA